MEDEKEDKPKSKASEKRLSFKRQFISCSCFIVAPIAIGVMEDSVNHGITVDRFYKHFKHPYFSMILRLTNVLAAYASALSLIYFGRKTTAVANMTLILSTIMLYGAQKNPTLHLFSYGVFQFSQHFFGVVYYVYIAEACDVRKRAFFLSLNNVGYFLGFFIGNFYSIHHRYILIMAITIAIFALILSIYAEETPYALALVGDEEGAADTFEYFRGDGDADADEMDEILEKAELVAKNRLKNIVAGVRSTKFLVPLALFFFMKLAEDDMCYLLNPLLLNEKHERESDRNTKFITKSFFKGRSLDDLLRVFIPIVGTLIGASITFVLSRRLCYMIPLLLNIVMLSTYFFIDLASSIPYYVSYLCILFTYMGPQTIPRIVAVEIFPAVTREIGIATVQAIDFIFNELEYYTMTDKFISLEYQQFSKVRWIFVPLGVFYGIFFMPETKDLTLNQAEKVGTDLNIYFGSGQAEDEED